MGIGRVTIDAEPWIEFVDPDGRLTTPAKELGASKPCILLVEFGPDLHVDAHSHPYDPLYIPLWGEVDFGDDGKPPLVPGQVRWVEGGKVYGPEVGGLKALKSWSSACRGAQLGGRAAEPHGAENRYRRPGLSSRPRVQSGSPPPPHALSRRPGG